MNAVVNRMTPDITTMIRLDHSHVLALFHRYKVDTSVNKKRALVTNACLALQVHAQLEEEIFYPALRNVMGGDEVLEKSEPEHQQMRDFISELRERSAGGEVVVDESFDNKFMDLMRIVIHHVADEETRLLPAAERLMRDDLGRLGAEMTRRRIELMRPYAGEIAVSAARSFPVGTATGAALLTVGAVAIGAMLLSSRSRDGRTTGTSGRTDLRDRERFM
jgi:hemerythrin-like domain-containing protein